MSTPIYTPRHPVRIVTAGSLFDGHDAAINLMRRLMQATGAEVIHLGHNRSVQEIVETAIQEDVQGIAITSYQGGHLEFFKYLYDLLQQKGGGHIKIFGGGGGTILPTEIEELHAYGITRLYSPDDGRALGLQGMINDLVARCDFSLEALPFKVPAELHPPDASTLARLITYAELGVARELPVAKTVAPVLGITGTGGAGKSSLVDELVRRFVLDFTDKTVAIVSVDPTRRRSGGALLGDRIRMNALHPGFHGGRVFMRSMATRGGNRSLSRHVADALGVLQAARFDLIILESSGIGQSDSEITDYANLCMYVMTAEYGAGTQLEKIDMLDYADLIAINKFDKQGSLDALRDVRKQYRRNHNLWETPDDELPVLGTVASQFNDPGLNQLYALLTRQLARHAQNDAWLAGKWADEVPSLPSTPTHRAGTIPPERVRYLADIVDSARRYGQWVEEQAALATQLYQLEGTLRYLREQSAEGTLVDDLSQRTAQLRSQLQPDCQRALDEWPATQERYCHATYRYTVRDRTIELPLYSESLSHLQVPKIALPRYRDWGDILRWLLTENVPGAFPYTAGVFPLKRKEEDPTRMFAGEGGPERTNRRFHYLSQGMPAKRLSTAFDSVTLYGEDPDRRPDIYGKVGNSGVSICTLDDVKKLYSGFNLCDPATSVSMTINGPAPMVLGFFLNAAIDQQCELYINRQGGVEKGWAEGWLKPFEVPTWARYQGTLPAGHDGLGLLLLGTTGDQVLAPEVYQQLKADTLRQVRGTVQADILKEDQAQNTCIFSTDFALCMMGDIQAYFIQNQVRNFYSVSVSGYHIAEAGANPISQLAFTLSNGFTLVEYYLARGMKIDDFAPNLSFFFSNGMDPEYAVLGRVARRIWAKAMKYTYHANERSQKLKYHIQTSGRSLHAQEIAFNDIRTTLQALLAIYDNCNSLHTNAYDEAITTPTEESVRRAMAIQLIINQEFGLARNENPQQGSFIIEELTDLVEEAVYQEFLSLNERGGVLGAMERMYQRGKIQDESHYYETRKHSGSLPIVGVNTFLDPQGSPTRLPSAVIRATEAEKTYAVEARQAFQHAQPAQAAQALGEVQKVASRSDGNVFAALMEATKVCTLGQLSTALYGVGGQYRRNM
ncbi:methylmalonyl-CoA mutase family protein [Rhabdobacter roseus]|uniref:Fused isobutyryl-CoA mutase n=1 Tax=Rhabdobacter roseus TaxID=1655419 RepID=A0A840TQ38_9BACT|nr:methylmalonyl-CoA mutase family protein [Rhabdobacter roseus]MBB5283672.1 methylmalonyl-CoA mutase [Rhabdobacter roseus]